MDSLHHLEELFAKFPGIGPRQAKRFVYYLLNKSPSYIKEFTQLVEDVKKSTSECEMCHRIFVNSAIQKSGSKTFVCSICNDSSRDKSTLMVVARDSDYETVEKSSAYKGLYFVLGGTVPILDNDPEKRIRLKLLLERVLAGQKNFKEIILSLNTTPDGEHTANIVKEALVKILKNSPLYSAKVSVLGRGLSTGAELEYVDSETIKNALQNRH
ncbi:MAG: recombination protein RecR, recombination protein RecR [Candidatus Parcubacteria bacterium]|jgi:recombination protein RecR